MVHDSKIPAAAEQLVADLEARGYRAKILDRVTPPTRLEVSNPVAAVLSETIIIHEGAFWWPWRHRIGPTADVPGAAERIARVLATRDDMAG